MARRLQQRTTAFVTAPIVFLAIAALAVVLGSLIIGARETDKIALTQQRETIEHALDQHGNALARELRVQTVWNEAYEKAHARDRAWLQKFYGEYLSQLFGYDGIYVLSGNNEPVFGFADGHDEPPTAYLQIGPELKDLVGAVRTPHAVPANYDVITTTITLGNGETIKHRAIADVRNIRGTPATVVVSTIVPDHTSVTPVDSPPFLLVAIEDLDPSYTKNIGAGFGLADLKWIKGAPAANESTEVVQANDGTVVGTLAWQKDQPGWQFVRRVAVGLAVALVLLGVLAVILTRWGRQQARQLLQSEAEARHAASTDALTGLPNRVAINETLPKLVDEARWHTSTLGVLSIDVDQFKQINDDFGHGVGDATILAIAKRLQGLLGADAVLVRLDGDEFMALVPEIDAEHLAELAADIVTALAEPIDVAGGTRVFVTASVGYALAPRDGARSDDLVRRVELALDHAKAGGGGMAVAFAPEMDLELSRRRALEAALRAAVADKTIDVAYQPIMDPGGRRVLGVEALARWTDPLLGSVSPDVFVPLAEETGLITKIGELVLRRALADGLAWPGVKVAVNVSGAQIHHGDVVAVVGEALRTTKFPPQRLEIEITESVLLADERRADEQIKGLQSLGVAVALDDFGSGYSSLMYLRRFGFDKLKIDRSFIEEIGTSHESTVILASIIRLGLDLEMTITAEGIETSAQRDWLAAAGCHQLQGFLFSRPLSAGEITAFIGAHQPAAAAG